MDKPMSNLSFRGMSWLIKLRDIYRPRENILAEAGIKPGFQVLDYGCGPGSYVFAAAPLVGESGRIYALDIHPVAVKRVGNIAARKRLTNIETILSDCATGLPDKSMDIVLLYDILHLLANPDEVLAELYRVLCTEGILSFNDHHLKDENGIITRITGKGLFTLSKKGKRVYNFLKVAR
ncbi:class I SAM-dependent methyltransferase [Chloroflexota bacterium]